MIKAKLKVDYKQNTVYFLTAGKRKQYGRAKHPLFSLDLLSGRIYFYGPKKKLP